MVEVLIEEMFGSDCNRSLDHERAMVVNTEQEETDERRKTKTLLSAKRSLRKKVFDGTDMVRDVWQSD